MTQEYEKQSSLTYKDIHLSEVTDPLRSILWQLYWQNKTLGSLVLSQQSQIDSLSSALSAWRDSSESHTTASPTTASPLGVQDTVATGVRTPPSSPSGLQDTKSGPAEHELNCVHQVTWTVKYKSFNENRTEVVALELHCPIHHVSWWFGKTPAQVAALGSSTSVNEDSKSFADGPSPEAAKWQWRW